MTTYAGKCFAVVSVGGVAQYGSVLTRSNAAHKRLFLYPNQSQGYGSLVVKPGDMRDLSRMTWGGLLSVAGKGLMAGMCGISGSPSFATRLTPTTQPVVYGGVGVGAYSAGGCFGVKLRLTGRSGQPVKFSLAMNGKVATTTTVNGGGGDSAEFFPLELGTGGEAILGFDIDYRTGFFPRFAPDGSQGYTEINESLRLRQLRATLLFAKGSAAATAAFAAYSAIEPVTQILGLASPGGGSCSINLGGYYTDWGGGEVAGIMVEGAVLTGVSDHGGMIGIN